MLHAWLAARSSAPDGWRTNVFGEASDRAAVARLLSPTWSTLLVKRVEATISHRGGSGTCAFSFYAIISFILTFSSLESESEPIKYRGGSGT